MSYLYLDDLAKEYVDLKERAEDTDAINPLDEEEQERLKALTDLDGQFDGDMEGYARNESAMIPKEAFEDYAQELAADVGYLTERDKNPLIGFIDWTAWAESVAQDYREVTFEGREYLIRA